MIKPTLEDILKIASLKFNDEGELVQTSLKADFIGHHEGDHKGDHIGNHEGNHIGYHRGDHDGVHIQAK